MAVPRLLPRCQVQGAGIGKCSPVDSVLMCEEAPMRFLRSIKSAAPWKNMLPGASRVDLPEINFGEVERLLGGNGILLVLAAAVTKVLA